MPAATKPHPTTSPTAIACVSPPKYPGKPEDYKYIVTEYCKLKKRHAKQESEKKITAAQNKVELRKVQAILDMYGQVHTPGVDGKTLRAIEVVHALMVAKASRVKFPDPAQRFSEAVKKVEHGGSVPVFVVMGLLQDHLKSL